TPNSSNPTSPNATTVEPAASRMVSVLRRQVRGLRRRHSRDPQAVQAMNDDRSSRMKRNRPTLWRNADERLKRRSRWLLTLPDAVAILRKRKNAAISRGVRFFV